MRRREPGSEGGFSLIELVIAITITGMLMAGLSSVFVTAINDSKSTDAKTIQSNDAQLTAAYLTRDAQAAGGTNPVTGTFTDSTLGISTSDATIDGHACDWTKPGETRVLVVSFKWIDQAAGLRHVAAYAYASVAQDLVRVTCDQAAGGSWTTSELTLASNIVLPTAACTALGAPVACATTLAGSGLAYSMPDSVTLTVKGVTSVSSPAPSPFKLTASIRTQTQAAPTTANAAQAPLVLLGRNNCGPGYEHSAGLSAEFGGSFFSSNVNLHVYGQTIINTTDIPGGSGCPAMFLAAGATYTADSGTSILQGGTCNTLWSDPCPPAALMNSYSPALTDPYENLEAPPQGAARSGCSGPGYYAAQMNISGTCTLSPGIYYLDNGIRVSGTLKSSGGVLLYIKNGSFDATGGTVTLTGLSAPSPYAGLVIWQDKSDTNAVTFGGNIFNTSTLSGTIYAPSAKVIESLALAATLNITSVVAQSFVVQATASFFGIGGVNIGTPFVPLDINAQTLANGKQGQAYSEQLSAIGGIGAYTWSASGLPAGLTIDPDSGIISGTPTGSGTTNFTVTATDEIGPPGAGHQDTRSFSIKVISSPTCASLSPNSLGRGAPSQTVTLTGSNFVSGANAAFSGTGLTVTNQTVVNASTMTVKVAVASNATLGNRTVTVTNSDGANITCTGGFTVTLAPPATVTGVTPAFGSRGATSKPITITGTNFITGASVSFGSNITTSGTTVVNATTITTNITITTSAATGLRNVTVTNGDGNLATGGTNAFTVNVQPTITSLVLANKTTAPPGTAGKVDQGDTITIKFSGPMSLSSFCSSWTVDGVDQSLVANNDVSVTLNDSGGAGSFDSIEVTSNACGGAGFQFGSIDLNNSNYVSNNSDAIFKGNTTATKSTITWTAATNTLVITLGAKTGSGTVNTVTSSVAKYTADTAILDTGSGPIAAAFSTGTIKQF